MSVCFRYLGLLLSPTPPLFHNVFGRTLFTLALVITLSVPAQKAHAEPTLPDAQDTTNWTLELNRNGIKIYIRDWPGSRFPAVRTVQTVSSTLTNATDHFLNTEAYPEWATDMREARILVPIDERMERLIYLQMDLPWPFMDRDSVVLQHISQDPDTLSVTFREREANERIDTLPSIVRLPKVNAELMLIPISPSETKIIWQGHNEPGGYLPAFVFRWMLENILYESSLNMRERLERPSQTKQATWVKPFSNNGSLADETVH